MELPTVDMAKFKLWWVIEPNFQFAVSFLQEPEKVKSSQSGRGQSPPPRMSLPNASFRMADSQ
jgi:hypothetical protein